MWSDIHCNDVEVEARKDVVRPNDSLEVETGCRNIVGNDGEVWWVRGSM